MMHDEDEGILSPPGCGAELSFYEEQYFHDNCDKVSRNCPYSAKMESRKLFGLSLEHDSEVPTWNLNDEDWENSSTESEQASKETNSKLAGKLSIGLATGLPGQEYLEDIYDAISQTGNQRLLQALENFVASTADTISQKNNENERLDAALRRATEKNSENARNLEEEMEQQILMLENKVREEEKRKAEKAIQDAQLKIEEKNHEITAIKEKLEQNLANQPAKENETAEEIKERDLENESLRSTLRESQTQLALYRTEIANLKSEYDEQGERLSKERQTVLRCVHEQESLTRQLQLLHEANRKLHDTNDDLRAAIENQKRMDEEAECMSPSKRNSLYGSPLGPYKKNPYARGSVTPSSQGSRSAVTSPTPGMDAKSLVSSPTSRPIDTNEFNESSLMSELMAADEQGFRNMNNSRASVVDDSLSAKEKEQMMEQLRILCDTNKRLSESNDELREALGLLSHSVKKKEVKRSSKNSSRCSSLSDYNSSAPSRTDSRSSSRNSKSSKVDRPSSTSSPRRNPSRQHRKSSISTTDESASDTTSGMNSSYSVIQNLEDELSMYARQQSDEEIDEDDMTIGELQRIKEMTSSGSDLDSDADVTYEERLPNGSRVEFSDNNANPDPDLRKPERTYKLVLAGDAAVGKSSFIVRLCKDKFYPSLNSTLGVDFQMKNMNIDGHLISLQLWDTAGQERFRSIAKSYFRRVDGVFLLYDVTSESSFLNVRDWTESIRDNSIKPVPIMLCGNKVDLRSSARAKDRPVITREQGEQLAQSIDAFFIETSSRNNTNITEAVQHLARMLESQGDKHDASTGMTLGETPEAKKKPGCCK